MRSRFFGLIISLAALCGCDNPNAPDFFKSVGDEVTDTTFFDDFVTLYNIDNSFDISIVKDTVDYAVVTCGKNLIDKVKADWTEPHAISFTNGNEYPIVRNYEGVPKAELHYTYPGLNIYLNASCKVHSQDSVDLCRIVFTDRAGNLDLITNANDFCLEVWFGTGTFNVRGRSEIFRCEPRYSSIIDASQLSVKKAFINQFSTGDVFVNPTDSLIAKIFWTGDIVYKGNPAVKLLENPGKGGLINKQ
ncbi:MAG: DUF2807 domain-containing protein [Bacteroidales bacterium]|nr:DUF2807 domain-containing protein [Bacteroidales bacterium]